MFSRRPSPFLLGRKPGRCGESFSCRRLLIQLSEEQLAKLRAAEAALGENVVLLAYDRPLEPAHLTPEQMDLLHNLEAELRCAYVVAYRRPRPGA